jgi:hypothetical protein
MTYIPAGGLGGSHAAGSLQQQQLQLLSNIKSANQAVSDTIIDLFAKIDREMKELQKIADKKTLEKAKTLKAEYEGKLKKLEDLKMMHTASIDQQCLNTAGKLIRQKIRKLELLIKNADAQIKKTSYNP